MKVFLRNIHLYLSLAAGVVILCSCITGTILVFEKEINQAINPQYYHVDAKGQQMPIALLVNAAIKEVPKSKATSVLVYNDPARSVEVSVTLPGKKTSGTPHPEKNKESVKAEAAPGKKDKKSNEGRKPQITVFVNPYTGQVLGQYSKKESFFNTVEMLHRFLLAGKDSAGDMIVGICTLLFLFILITGVILWWPKTKAVLRQRIKVKWDANTKRLVHDLHLVTGFYTSVFLIVIVLTGLIMSFKWANTALFALTGSKQAEKQEAPHSKFMAAQKPVSIDVALRSVNQKTNTAEYYNLRLPADTTAAYSVNILPKGAFENTSDAYFIDQYSGRIIGSELFANKSLGQRVRSFVKPVHTGAVYGVPTKILSFVICLLACIFPVTGVMMWLNRIGKKPKRKNAAGIKKELTVEGV
ncbi:PepSY-associated TM helix domain-containing protein [Mucilaginibacter psychrotolerans]|uniref:PepSY domain-containing protein n=1 Tax=Mucilaginibacter psychrotolerans TaxID=1524096 RepID=A0A4Y8S7P7_9SPHI|nr:PepSY-associated TM helix domain-containing protein [Mucilaginibacter psychrotolerans]TFF34641.1 PepSY domain-containing protein [Mucilaginibacter psychrotolerans]